MSQFRPPSVDQLASIVMRTGVGHHIAVAAARAAIEKARAVGGCEIAELEQLALDQVVFLQPYPRVVNASGVLLHTGLGRAELSQPAIQAMEKAAGSIALEFDLETGSRGDRQLGAEKLLIELTGAESAMVVNNCAAALILALNSIAPGREVVVSRGELIEIGGHFRLPDVILQSSCSLREVGTTNRTYLSDYESAVGADTGALLKSHPSNFAVEGFTCEATVPDLAQLSHTAQIPFIYDLGHGNMLSLTQFGLPAETTVAQAIAEGADLVLFSGDKLLGATQSGIIVGKSDLIQKLRANPLARALRIDKQNLTGLVATLNLYVEKRHLEIPLWSRVARPLEEVKLVAQHWISARKGGSELESVTRLGSGSLPSAGVPTVCAAWNSERPDQLARKLRLSRVPIIGRVESGFFLLDPRCITKESDIKLVYEVLKG